MGLLPFMCAYCVLGTVLMCDLQMWPHWGLWSDKPPTSAHSLQSPTRFGAPITYLMPSTFSSPLHKEALHSSIINSLLVAKLMPSSGPLYFMFPLPGKSPPFPLCDCFLLIIHISAQMSLSQKNFPWPYSL